MRTIKVIAGEIDGKKVSTVSIINEAASTGGAGKMNLAGMRARIRVLDAVDASDGKAINIEDADFAVLTSIIEGMDSWAVADRTLLTIIEGILGAEIVNIGTGGQAATVDVGEAAVRRQAQGIG